MRPQLNNTVSVKNADIHRFLWSRLANRLIAADEPRPQGAVSAELSQRHPGERSIPTLLILTAALAGAQTTLTLQQAEALAIQNHPQIQAAQNEVNFAHQQVTINRAPYYPAIAGEITGSQANNLARIGAGDLSASRLFNRFGQGAGLTQLVTDSGRTPNLVASAAPRPRPPSRTSQPLATASSWTSTAPTSTSSTRKP